MQNRYVADIGDYVKLAILRVLSPGYHLGVAWWLFPDEGHNKDGRHIDYLDRADLWRRFNPDLFDILREVVARDQRHVSALEAPDILSEAVFANEMFPVGSVIGDRQQERCRWFARIKQSLADANLVFVDPDNGLEPRFYSPGSTKSGKSILISELQALARPGRCLIVYHHQTRRAGGHHGEIEHWAERLRACGFTTVDALRAKPYSPRVFFLLDAPADVRQRAGEIEDRWMGLISWHPDGERSSPAPRHVPISNGIAASPPPSAPRRPGVARSGFTTQTGYVNRNNQIVVRPTGKPGTDHGQYVYVLCCQDCGHEYGRTVRAYGCVGVRGMIEEHRDWQSDVR
jgi:hypothetical protein